MFETFLKAQCLNRKTPLKRALTKELGLLQLDPTSSYDQVRLFWDFFSDKKKCTDLGNPIPKIRTIQL